MSELSICETVGERRAGSNNRWFPHFIHTNYLLYTGEVGGGYNSGGFPISYYIENEKFFELKSREYRDGIKRKETR